jgi:CDP-archaeol synthase
MSLSALPELEFEFGRIAYLFFPLLGSAISLGLCIRYNWAAFIAVPIDGRATMRGRRLFGDNKTLRGLIAAGLGTAVAMALQAQVLHYLPPARALEYFDYSTIQPWSFGFLLGLAGMASELPNSFFKRQLDIPPGRMAKGRWLPVFYIWDQVDVLLGSWIVFAQVIEVTLRQVLVSIVVVFVIHQLVNLAGYALGMRKTDQTRGL